MTGLGSEIGSILFHKVLPRFWEAAKKFFLVNQIDNTNNAPEEVSIPKDMLTTEKDNEEEPEQEEPGKRDQLVVREREEGETQEGNTIEVHTWSTT